MILPPFHWAKHIGWLGGNSSTLSVGGTSATQIPFELHSVLRIRPYNWIFPNCSISFIMDQSTNSTTNEWLLQVAYGKTCPTLGALQFAWQQNHSAVCTKSKDVHNTGRSCLFWSSVFATFCPLKNPHNFRSFWWRSFKSTYTFITIVVVLHQLVLVCLRVCFLLLLLLSVYFLEPDEDNFLSKTLGFLCFLVFRPIG